MHVSEPHNVLEVVPLCSEVVKKFFLAFWTVFDQKWNFELGIFLDFRPKLYVSPQLYTFLVKFSFSKALYDWKTPPIASAVYLTWFWAKLERFFF